METRSVRLIENKIRQQTVALLGVKRAFQAENILRRIAAQVTFPLHRVWRPIFIWGAARSGSYLLYDIISLHPNVICLRHFSRLAKGLYGSLHYGGGEYDYILNNPFPPVEGAKEFLFKPVPLLEKEVKWDNSDLHAVERSFRLLKASSFFADRIIDKSPKYTFFTDMLDRMFPDAFHVHCVRHPVAVSLSYIRRMQNPSDVDEYGFWGWVPGRHNWPTELNLEEKAVLSVTKIIQQALKNRERLRNRYFEVRYEDLTRNPEQTIKGLLHSLKLNEPPEILAALPDSFPQYNLDKLNLTSIDRSIRLEFEGIVNSLGYTL